MIMITTKKGAGRGEGDIKKNLHVTLNSGIKIGFIDKSTFPTYQQPSSVVCSKRIALSFIYYRHCFLFRNFFLFPQRRDTFHGRAKTALQLRNGLFSIETIVAARSSGC